MVNVQTANVFTSREKEPDLESAVHYLAVRSDDNDM